MSPKEKLKLEFSRNPDRYYRVRLFDELGFARRKCQKCGSYFWTLDPERKICPNPPCENYSFIGKPPIPSMDYIETWRKIEKFFVKNGHESVPSYPVVCRWFPGLYFTVASIVDFQRSMAGKTVFEMPAERIIIPQVCLRFSDTENVGVTGRHMTNFIMIGQHSIHEKVNGKYKGYWKDTCIDLDYKLLTEALKIKPEQVTFMEDVWVGPNAFGYSLEYFTGGLELGNAVFTEFVGTPEKYKQMDYKVIDMGAGLERFTWLSQGTPTAYDAVYGPVMRDLKKACGFDTKLFDKYASIAGGLNIDETQDILKIKAEIAKKLGVSLHTLNENVEPLQALYAVADHAKTLLYAIGDGGLLSNVGGGYNLRIIFRRALSFIDEYDLGLDLFSVCKKHARYLRSLNPDLMKSLPELQEILGVEEKRYKATKDRGKRVVFDMIRKKEKLDNKKLVQLYESQGITPELIKEVSEKEKADIKIPADFYKEISSRHMVEEVPEEKVSPIDVSGIEPTKLLFYAKERDKKFRAKVLKVIKDGGNWVILDQTLFYPEGGGQDFDTGKINGKAVNDVQKFGSVVAHKMDSVNFKQGATVHGEIDWDRRLQLAQHHTAVHIINGAARRLLGNHVWQAGAAKTMEKAHLDITHYEALSMQHTEKLEDLSNNLVKKAVKVNKTFMSRGEAEKMFGMRIYQGGAIPDNTIRIVNTPGWDVEACAGTHLGNTRDTGKIVVVSTERIQDGVDRITLKAGKAGQAYLDYAKSVASKVYKILQKNGSIKFSKGFSLHDEFKALRDLRRSAAVFSVGIEQLEGTARKFSSDLEKMSGKLKGLGKLKPDTEIKTFHDLNSALKFLFESWKSSRKVMEGMGSRLADEKSAELIKKAKKGMIFELLEADRPELIKTASNILAKNPKLTVILANSKGDIVGMSKTKDMGSFISDICHKCKGKGGGRKELGQGKICDTKSFLKIKKICD
jgi:alanyl-tRNA synthetase